MKKRNLMPTVVLGSICLVIALLLSVINSITAPVIAKNKKYKEEASLRLVLEGAGGFEEIDISENENYPDTLTAAYKADIGYVFTITERGYADGLVIMCGIGNDGKIKGIQCIDSNETNGVEYILADRFIDKSANEMSKDLISGPTSTMTSNAYYRAIEAAFLSFTVAQGGKTPAQILKESCNAALGTEGLEFEKLIMAAAYDGISAIYGTKSGENIIGVVFVIGDVYVGVKPNGDIVTNVSDDIKAKAEAAFITYTNSALTEVSKPTSADPELNAKIENDVISIKKNSFGTYVIELQTKGVAADPEYGSYYQPIKIRVMIDKDGKIASCETLFQGESTDIGDVCGTEEYTNQYIGAEKDDIPDGNEEGIGHIAGATWTASGYRAGVKLAFEVYELLIFKDVEKPISTDAELNAKIENDVIGIKMSAAGTYVIELQTKGVAADPVNGHWYQPIKIRVTIDKDGKIASCETLFQGESTDYGDVCGTDEYTNQYIGASLSDIPDGNEAGIGHISGATWTASGYRAGVKLAFAVFELLTAEPREITKPTATDSALNEKIQNDVISIKVDAWGSYIVELQTTGVAADPVNGHWYQPIKIRVTISRDGKIVDCLTVFQGESTDYGDVCGTDEYTNQYIGASLSDIPDGNEAGIGHISGATWTASGYRAGVKLAFAVFELLTGGNA